MHTLVLLTAILGGLGGCGRNKAVFQAYVDAKAAATSDPGPAPANWKPDLKVQLSEDLLDRLITYGLEENGELKGEVAIPGIPGVGDAALTPTLTVDALDLSESKRCDACLAVDLDMSGTADWAAGFLGSGTVPFEASVALDVEFETKREDQEWRVVARPRDVRSVSVDIDGLKGAVRNVAEEPLRKWLDDNLVQRLKPVEVSRFSADSIPLRALNVRASKRTLVIEMLSDMPLPGVVDQPDANPRKGFVAWMATDTLVRFAAREAFEAGPMTYDIVPEVRGLSIDKQRFSMDLRLWKVGGAGWWRDYTASGKVGVRKETLKLIAEDVAEGDKSEGAAMADPLFFLGEGIVASEMEKAMRGAIPNVFQQKVGDGTAALTVLEKTVGRGSVLEVRGTVNIIEAVEGFGPKKKGTKGLKGKSRLGRGR